MILIDTDILVESLRGSIEATTWLASIRSETFGIPGVVAMELLMGCRNQNDLQRVRKFLSSFQVIWPDATDSACAYDLLLEHRLSSGLGIPDCLIAATALVRGARLFSFNIKHFGVIPGLEVQQPYKRP